MTAKNLIESMEMNAEERILEMIHNAHNEADEIIKSAEAKAETIKHSYLENAIKFADAERNRQIYTVKTEVKMHVIIAKDELLHKAFVEAKKNLINFRERRAYKNSYKLMVQEAVHELEGEELEFHIDKKDENLCKEILEELSENSGIVADITCAGGLNVSTSDEKIVIFNTIESRLDKAKELLKFETFSTLFGD